MRIVKHIPNAITSGNVACGTLATLFAIYGKLDIAVLFILIAALLDFLDGLTARLLNAYSEMGKELDSLADVVSFGVAPAALLFSLLRVSIYGDVVHIDEIVEPADIAILSTAVIMPICGALRLAKFNVDPDQSQHFKGIPIPANALIVCSLVLINLYGSSPELNSIISSPYLLAGVGVFSSLLMVSNFNLFSLKFKNLSFKDNRLRYIMLAIAIVALATCGAYSLFIIMALYIALSLLLFRVK